MAQTENLALLEHSEVLFREALSRCRHCLARRLEYEYKYKYEFFRGEELPYWFQPAYQISTSIRRLQPFWPSTITTTCCAHACVVAKRMRKWSEEVVKRRHLLSAAFDPTACDTPLCDPVRYKPTWTRWRAPRLCPVWAA